MRIAWTITAMACALFCAGCGGVPGTTPTQTITSSVPGVALQGTVRGGQQPIVGAHVYLYAANTNGYGSPSISLLTSGSGKDSSGNYYVTTQAGGIFNISSDYTCPGAGTQVYLYAVGGDPGVGSNNAAAGLLAGLGNCDVANFSSLYVVINEVSTVATAYAIAGFATDATHVSSSGTTLALQGISNAFGTPLNCGATQPCGIANLETLSTGVALAATPAGNGTVPQQEINALANILAACINTTGTVSPTTPCGILFANAMNGGTQPSDTATAAINIAHNPGANITNLFALQSGSPPFQPALTAAPNDFTLAVTYSGSGLDGSGFAPNGVAIDGLGNVWVTNFDSNSLSEFNSSGAPLSGTTGFISAGLSQPTSIAIDIYNNAWAANFQGDSLSEFNKYGTKISGPPGFTGSGLNTPYGIAIDNNGHVWVSDSGGNNLSEFSSGGVALSGTSGFAPGSIAGPAGIASDTSGDIWSTNWSSATSSLIETLPNGTQSTNSPYESGGLNSPYAIAIDSGGNLWVTNQGGNGSITELSSTGQAVGTSPFSGGGVDDPYGIAVDGGGNAWTANYGGNSNSVSEFNSSGTAITGTNGYVSNGLLEPYGVAIDGSGNVWVASRNTSGPLTELVGAASPVVTPLAVGVELKQLGTKP